MRESDYEYCFTEQSGEFDCKAVRRMRTKHIYAGDTLEIECYPLIVVNREQRRQMKRARTKERQHAINRRNRSKRVRRLIEANFTAADYVVHGTYDYGVIDSGFVDLKAEADRCDRIGIPWDYGDALRDVQNYVRRVRDRQRRRNSAEAVKYLYVIEGKKRVAEALPERFHLHMVIHAPSLSRDELESLWQINDGRGYCNVDRLCLKHNGAHALAEYITQHNARVNTSRNLTAPRVTVSDHKLSPSKAMRIARDVMIEGERIIEKQVNKGRDDKNRYICIHGLMKVYFSDFLPGAYIFARLRRKRAEAG